MEDQDLFPFDEQPEYQESHEEFSYPRSVLAGVLVLSVLVLVIVFWQMKANLTLEIPNVDTGSLALDDGGSLLDLEDEVLKTQDSDEDGLSDFEEIRIFGTSPFIADTDSDGVFDAEEVALGEDPNCAKGESCFLGLVDATNSNVVPSELFASEELNAVMDNPDEIRRLLLKNGADPTLVESLDDQSLQILARESFETFRQPTEESIDLLSGLDAQQLRGLLSSFGLTDAKLDSLSDDELMEMFERVAQEQKALLQEAGLPVPSDQTGE